MNNEEVTKSIINYLDIKSDFNNTLLIFNIDKKISSLLFYFEYFSPFTSSKWSKILDEKLANNLFQQIIKIWENNKTEFVSKTNIFVSKMNDIFGKKRTKSFKKMICYKNNESELGAILRHIRNSISHGNFYIKYSKSNNKFLFFDFDKSKRFTFALAIDYKTLKKWKDIIIEGVKEKNGSI